MKRKANRRIITFCNGKIKREENTNDASLGVHNWRKRPLVPLPSDLTGFKNLAGLSCLVLLLLFFPLYALPQSIEVIRDSRVDTLVNRYTRVHQHKESIEGYRIQVAAGSNRTNVYEVKSKFYKLYPDIKQYLIYQAPNFKLRAGNYRTRLEASKDLQEIMRDFNGAFIIRDEIKISEL